MTRNNVFFSIDEVEKDFDKALINLDQVLVANNLVSKTSQLDSKIDKNKKRDSQDASSNACRNNLSIICSSFGTMLQYTLTLAELNAKLEAELVDLRNKLLESKSTIESHDRIENDLLMQIHSTQLEKLQLSTVVSSSTPSSPTKQTKQDLEKSSDTVDSDKPDSDDGIPKNRESIMSNSSLNSLKCSMERTRSKIKADESIIIERNQLRKENELMRDQIAKNSNDLYAARLTSKYLDKELAGRIQQLQLIGKGKMSSEDFGKLWNQLESEIFLHRQKTLIQACRANHNNIKNENLNNESKRLSQSSSCEQLKMKSLDIDEYPNEPLQMTSQVREVKIIKTGDASLGMSITGGDDLGVPIIISDLSLNGVAAKTGQLVVGDAIISINGMSFNGLSHSEAAAVLSNARGEICLEVQFLIDIKDEDQ